ncbi:haloalkane dehalogenase [Streptomyces sp. NPDC002004]
MTSVLRTPDDRFTKLPDFPFDAHYVEIDGGLRVHYLDEGPRDGEVVLLMHGEPSWSFLYRKVIPVLVAAGHRCIAPDLVGFGRSDKPADPAAYTYQRHVDWMSEAVFDRLGLSGITFFGQDWGGLIGLRLLAARPELYSRAVVANTGLPTGAERPTDAFLTWQRFSRESPDFPIGHIVSTGCVNALDDDVVAAYDAPFPEDIYKAGARIFPSLVPTSPDDPSHAANTAAWRVLDRFDNPFLCAFSDSDPITRGADSTFLTRVPGTGGQPHTTIEGAGHFLQEDKGEELAGVIAAFMHRGR